MGEIRIEVEYFKDGLPSENGDYNEYGTRNYKNALYAADVSLDDNVADEVTFYVSKDDDEPALLSFTKNTFNIDTVSEKIEALIKQTGE